MPGKNKLPEIKLTPEQTKVLQDMSPELALIDRELKKASLAGIDVTEQRKAFEENTEKRSNLLKYYGTKTKV
jgi:hypothetical protein